ncbi:undecaprenyl/decaprenyl-phosphate alpha-N-acetylglucosaminyl 1-phosphate transferase [Winogradskyella sp. DF17]|uniref:Undecaprenyl/decaprenyl-phosphate alpha-N-acetylglucosaminyl 1-phosphate transferase n=1 Tax=Winogradskyella pelagia TaxID=2819984 RepID=A0ABS3SZ78_9FLAO|nr:MraY family glycosyltransferase [Winogradskyella sp. DF17]MBO3115791.1 undecaprenyl/decaprenyl-phosphate alpha-N-acetylglucosaminyl 1-phosphate transferase [Winogradskyella sp. DF17]
MIQQLVDNFLPEQNIIPWLIIAFGLSFLIAFQTFPTILYVAREKHLMDVPDSRSVHSNHTPTLGGIGIFLGLIVVMTIVGAFLNTKVLLLVMGALTVLFFLGLKDDLTVLSARKKFLGQLFAASLLIVFTDSRIIGFSSILDIDILPYWVSVGFTLFVYVLIINAYNLIDGVDGLAGSIALCASGIFTYLFVMADDLSLATIAIALCGALIAFLRLNFSATRKIFMGDTGSMVVGFLLAFFTISFIHMEQVDTEATYYRDAPALAFALLFYPLMDTLRIFFIRIFVHKTSPFKADKNHIHHRFIQHGYSHLATTVIIAGINVLIVIIAFNLTYFDLNNQIFSLLLYGTVLYLIPFGIKKWALKP